MGIAVFSMIVYFQGIQRIGLPSDPSLIGPDHIINLVCEGILAASLLIYSIRAMLTGIQLINFFTTHNEFILFRFKQIDYYWTPDGWPTLGLVSYLFNIVFSADKLAMVADLLLASTQVFLPQWPIIFLICIMLPPKFILEFIIYPFLPQLNVPMIEWAELFGLESAKTYGKERLPKLTPFY